MIKGLISAVLIGLIAAGASAGENPVAEQYLGRRWTPEPGEEDFSSWEISREYSRGDYTVRFYRDPAAGASLMAGAFEILQGEESLFRRSGGLFYIGDHLPGEEEFEAGRFFGPDLTGDGQPNLAVWEYTGGAHCCSLLYLFEVGADFRFLLEFFSGEGAAQLEPVPGGGPWEICLADDTFAYWKSPYCAWQPAPVILVRENGRYRVGADRMLKPAPPLVELRERARKIWAEHARYRPAAADGAGEAPVLVEGIDISRYDQPPPGIWGVMLELIYSGNPQAAWEFYDLACPDPLPWKAEFAEDFRRQLASSPYYAELD